MNRRRLERELDGLASFPDPEPALEQYPTPADLAAHVVHLADLQGDLQRRVVDLGAGTGILAIAAALKGARVLGVELDGQALDTAVDNAARAGVEVDWILGDATDPPIRPRRQEGAGGEGDDAPSSTAGDGPTVLSNPPFGAQNASRGDRPFLAAIARIAAVSYTVHNAGSESFVESFAADEDGRVTHAFAGDIRLDRQFGFHEDDHREIGVEVFRIEWP